MTIDYRPDGEAHHATAKPERFRGVRLGLLIFIIQITLLLAIGGIMIQQSYSAADLLLRTTMTQRFVQAEEVAQSFLRENLALRSSSISLLANSNQLRIFIRGRRWSQAEDHLYNSTLDMAGYDDGILLLLDEDGNLRGNAGMPLPLADQQAMVADERAQLGVRQWRLVDGNEPVLLRSLPVTEPVTGRVIAHLMYGVALRDNWTLLQRMKRATGLDTLMLFVDDRLMVTTARDLSHLSLDLDGITQEDGGLTSLIDGRAAYTAQLWDTNTVHLDLVLINKATTFKDLTAAFRKNANVLGLLVVVGGVIALLILRRLVIRPAQHLSDYAVAATRRGAALAYTPTRIAEFDAAGQVVETAFRELRSINRNLEEHIRHRTRDLQNSETRLRSILDTAADGIITADASGQILSFNAAAERIFGYNTDEAVGRHFSFLLPKDRVAEATEDDTGALREIAAQRKSGEVFPIELAVSKSMLEADLVFTSIVRDISERKAAEAALLKTMDELNKTQKTLVESEKMASLGGLVAGVAHEINTPVGVGVTAATHLSGATRDIAGKYRSQSMTRNDLEAYLADAEQAGTILETNLRRAAELIRSFKQVAVDQTGDAVRTIDMADYVDEVLTSLHPKLKKTRITIDQTIPDHCSLQTRPGALAQVITNLIMNSLVHAFPDGTGTITLSAKQQVTDGDVVLMYADDGIGMSEDVRSRIFEPFFTTKRGGGGSGLGMHIIYNLITQSLDGTIACESTPGNGAVFTVTLPAMTENP